MSNTVHPLDDDLVDLAVVNRRIVRHLGRDGEYCEEDMAIITELNRVHSGVGEYRLREVAADAFKRNGPSRHTVALFKGANVRLVEMEGGKRSAQIIPFPVEPDGAA